MIASVALFEMVGLLLGGHPRWGTADGSHAGELVNQTGWVFKA
jgi:hypothetical protein